MLDDHKVTIINIIDLATDSQFHYRRTENTMDKDTKWVMRIRKSKKNRQHNGQKIPKG